MAGDAPGRAWRSRGLSLLLALSSTALGLGLLEVGFRAHAHFEEGRGLDEALREQARLEPGEAAGLRDLLRPSRNADIVYELKPGLSVTFRGRPASTSAAGFRDRDYAIAKAPGVVRIVGLGDSVMFGYGVGDGEDYLSLLETRLAGESRGARFEILNTAVPGYNGVMERATLEAKGLAYAPDLVIVGFCGNDLGLPNFLQQPIDYFDPRRSFLLEFVRGRLGTSDDEPEGLVERPFKVKWRDPVGEDLARVPPRYAHMVGLAAYDRTLKELRRMAVAAGFELLILFYPVAPFQVGKLVEANGIRSFSVAAAARRFMARSGGLDAGRKRLHLSPSDPHPSVEGHRVIADALHEYLADSGLLARIAARGAMKRP